MPRIAPSSPNVRLTTRLITSASDLRCAAASPIRDSKKVEGAGARGGRCRELDHVHWRRVEERDEKICSLPPRPRRWVFHRGPTIQKKLLVMGVGLPMRKT